MSFDFGSSNVNRLTSASLLGGGDVRPLSVGYRIKMNSTGDRGGGLTMLIYENQFSSDSNLSFTIGPAQQMYIYSGGFISSSAWTPVTTWQSLLVTWATGSPGAVAFYRNGATNGTASASPGGNTAGALFAVIGAGGSGTDPTNDTHYNSAAWANIDGNLCDFTFWNVVLTSPEALAWTAGASSLLIRPSAIRCYLPMTSSVTQDLYRGDGVWTAQGSNTKQDHPRVIMPSQMQTARQPYRKSMLFPPPPSPGDMHMLTR